MNFDKPGIVEDNYRDVISSTEEIIEDARNGRMFVLIDHEDRENEGDLVIPAQMATPDAINFMATNGRGLICLALTSERVDQLGLELMSTNNSSRHETAFTISIEAREVLQLEYLLTTERELWLWPLMLPKEWPIYQHQGMFFLYEPEVEGF